MIYGMNICPIYIKIEIDFVSMILDNIEIDPFLRK